MNRRAAGILSLFAWVTACGGLAAATEPAPFPQARDASRILADSVKRRPVSEEYLAETVVTQRDGKERRKVWRSYRNGPPDAAERLIRFQYPPDIRGVGYLSLHHPGKAADEWLYLPSMKRERRINVKDRDAAFVGTSFSYEDLDLLDFDPSRYSATLLPDDTVDGAATYRIDLVPRTPSAYTKKILTLRQDTLNLLAVDFFAADSALPVKRLRLTNYEAVGRYSIATRIQMDDVRKSTRTVITVQDVALDRPQPSDRYTIQNLLREDEAPRAAPPRPAPTRTSSLQTTPAPPREGTVIPALQGFSGYGESRLFGSFDAPAHSPAPSRWNTALLRETLSLGSVRLDASLRAEDSSSPQAGRPAFDPADRRQQRSAISIRTLSLLIPIRPALDAEVGRFQIAWGETDGYSPADAFFPRDLSDPLTEERLPLWGVHLRGERRGIRFEGLVVPVATPWRLPDLGAQHFELDSRDVVFTEQPWTVPREGFAAVRVLGTYHGVDLGGWVRDGERPAPVLVPQLDEAITTDGVMRIPLDRRFARERAGGASASTQLGGWIARAEVGLFDSSDADVGRAAIVTVGASHLVGEGELTTTVAANVVSSPVDPLLLFDRALLPAVIVAYHGYYPWGTWRAVWLETFHTVGGVLSVETTRNLTDAIGATVGADLPHGATFSPATAFSGGSRVRAGLRWSW